MGCACFVVRSGCALFWVGLSVGFGATYCFGFCSLFAQGDFGLLFVGFCVF